MRRSIVPGEITYIPQNTIKLEEKGAEQMFKLMEILDEHDDVRRCMPISIFPKT